jgi:hypothetical protein
MPAADVPLPAVFTGTSMMLVPPTPVLAPVPVEGVPPVPVEGVPPVPLDVVPPVPEPRPFETMPVSLLQATATTLKKQAATNPAG